MKYIGYLTSALLISGASLFCSLSAAQDDGFKSIADIEAALNPLETIANYDGVRMSIDLDIRFALNSATLTDSAKEQVAALGKALAGSALAKCEITLIGHTDASGSAENNLSLSAARATAVKQTLVDSYGVSENKLTAIGKGETALLEGLAKNDARHRRVQVALSHPEACKLAVKSADQEHNDERGNVDIEW
ncbi:OmpA family protein [Aestuariibacter sp. A3R04]|uniref:OmpA family protein n=1 Tax=Aestuariibacter sp. A3R04 TaxID=2841571 RepID=UPI001C098BF3|nr:OmpA family protein [Aestuariibacter sp. A3R04]MBU3020505.1 OmpA family protein [Aestuariibacter sp. A3R04]